MVMLHLSLETHEHGYVTPAEASALMANHNGFFVVCFVCLNLNVNQGPMSYEAQMSLTSMKPWDLVSLARQSSHHPLPCATQGSGTPPPFLPLTSQRVS